MGAPTADEAAGGAGRVELYACPGCAAVTRCGFIPFHIRPAGSAICIAGGHGLADISEIPIE